MTTTTTTIGGGTLTVTQKNEPYNEQQNYGAFAVIKSDGSVFAWGDTDFSSVASQLDGTIPTTQIFSCFGGFAALRSDGSVITWGRPFSSLFLLGSNDLLGSVVTKDDLNNSTISDQFNGDIDVTQIFSNDWFAAIRTDGSVASVVWDPVTSQQVEIHQSSIANQLNGSIPVTKIYSICYGNGFAAIRSDGSVVMWNAHWWGFPPNIDSSFADSLNGDIDVTDIYSTGEAIAALRTDGSVISWGIADTDYSTNPVTQTLIDTNAVASQLSSGVKQIYPISGGFIAIKSDGSVFIWGANSVANQLNGTVPVKQIYTVNYPYDAADAVAALREDGSFISWGFDNSAIASKFNSANPVKQIYSSGGGIGSPSYAALRADGSVFTWGDANFGGDSSSVASQLDGKVDVKEIYSTGDAFAALRVDGSVITWGWSGEGVGIDGSMYSSGGGGDSSSVASQINGKIDVTKIYSNGSGFTALRADGSVVTWGRNNDSSAVANELNGDIDVKEIYSTFNAFAALRVDGSVVVWGSTGSSMMGDYILFDSKAISKQIGTGVVSFANPATDDVYIAPAKVVHVNPPTTPIAATKATAGNDLLVGTNKADKLLGLAGNDTLIGGLGVDKLTGGKGADIFKFTALADSGTTATTRDTIIDFNHNENDKIDLSGIDANAKLASDQVFKFIGSTAFNKTDASGQLRFDATNKILYGSTDADTTPEFSIQLNGVSSLVTTDFIL